jgi:hypothetical protein
MNEIIKNIKKLDDSTYKSYVDVRKFELSKYNNPNIIGANRLRGGIKLGGYASNTKEFIDEDMKVGLEEGFDPINLSMGNNDEAYVDLFKKIKSSANVDFDTTMELVYDEVSNYFGNYDNVDKRLDYYQEDSINNISNLKGKNSAKCTERAMLAQNLLKLIGVDSTLKISQVVVDGKEDIHAYNLVQDDGKYYIFDSTIPTIGIDNKTTPIITNINKETYDKMSDEKDMGVSIKTNFYSPVTNNNYEEFDLNKKTDDKSEMFRINLLNNQLRWLTSNKQEVFKKSRLLYNLYKNNKLPNNVKDRCCNFPLLEEKCNEYNK